MAPSKRTAFAARLRELREKAGLTQAQLAQRSGLHLSAVTRFEQGLREPSLESAASLAGALGVTCDALLQPAQSTASRPRGRPRKPPPGETREAKKPRGRKTK
jgi:transcriptional regulator with XRE-family HTH domain